MVMEQEKNNMMKESLNNMKTDRKVESIVNEVIEESFDEDIPQVENTQSNDDSESSEDLEDITKELEDAKKLYEEMLKEQK